MAKWQQFIVLLNILCILSVIQLSWNRLPYIPYMSSKPSSPQTNGTMKINNITNSIINTNTNQTLLFNSLSSPNHTNDFTSNIINLANNYNHSNTRTVPILMSSNIANIHMNCLNGTYIRYIKQNTYCKLSNNISFIIHNKLAAGGQSYIFNVTIIQNNLTNQDYLLNIDNTYHSSECYEYQQVHSLLTRIYASNSSLNVPFMYPNIAVYYDELSKHCFIFTKHIRNTIPLIKLFSNNDTISKKYLSSMIKTKGSVLQFVVDCYNDIMAIYYLMYSELNVFHNDRHPTNILIDITTFKCYVIDFASLFYKENMWYRNKPKIHRKLGMFYCTPMSCSLLAQNYLRKMRDRMQFRKQLQIEDSEQVNDILFRVGMYAVEYEIATFMFHLFVKLYYLETHMQKDILFQMNQNVLNIAIKDKGFKGIRIRPYCVRYELYCKILFNNGIKYSNLQQEFLEIMSIFENDIWIVHNRKCGYMSENKTCNRQQSWNFF